MILASIDTVDLFAYLNSSILAYLSEKTTWEFVSSADLRSQLPISFLVKGNVVGITGGNITENVYGGLSNNGTATNK
jgi:hypothetical protein